MPPEAAADLAPQASPPLRLVSLLSRRFRDGALGPGEAAALRRLDPLAPDQRHLPALFHLLAEIEAPLGEDDVARLALIAHALALARGLHDPNVPPGRGMAELGLSEARLAALLAADFAGLADLLPRLARRLAAQSRAVDWRPLARLAWTAGRYEDEAEAIRRRLAADFVRATDAAAAPAATPEDADA